MKLQKLPSCWVRCTFVDVSFENGVMHVIYSIMVFDNDAHPKCQTHELCSQFGSPR